MNISSCTCEDILQKCKEDTVCSFWLQRRGRVWWGLFQCSEHLCNGVVAGVITSPWRSSSLCKQAELMSPSGVEDKDRRPHDSLTVELYRLSHPLTSFIQHNQSSLTLSSWPHPIRARRLSMHVNEKTYINPISDKICMRWTEKWKQFTRTQMCICESVLKYVIP